MSKKKKKNTHTNGNWLNGGNYFYKNFSHHVNYDVMIMFKKVVFSVFFWCFLNEKQFHQLSKKTNTFKQRWRITCLI